jgi:hypothetical protein
MSEEKDFGKWMEEYKCGCSNVVRVKSELPGYCPIHGEDRKGIIYKLEEKDKIECGVIK